MKEDLAIIQDTLESNLESQKIFTDHIKRLEEKRKNIKKKTPLEKAKEKSEENAKRLDPTRASESHYERSISMKAVGTCEWIFERNEYKEWRASGYLVGVIWERRVHPPRLNMRESKLTWGSPCIECH